VHCSALLTTVRKCWARRQVVMAAASRIAGSGAAAASTVVNSFVSAVRVSSVNSLDAASFSSRHLLDGDDSTCWQSEPAASTDDSAQTEHWIEITFKQPLTIDSFALQFQGGFAATGIELLVPDAAAAEKARAAASAAAATGSKPKKVATQYVLHSKHEASDTSVLQTFSLSGASRIASAGALKLRFTACSDHYGRVCIYHLKLFGSPAPAPS
jgi:hypothetical protein